MIQIHPSSKPQNDPSFSPLIYHVLASAPSRGVLDLGCGDGRHARLLAQQGCEVVAIGASEPALEQARAKAVPEGVQFLLGDIGAVVRRSDGAKNVVCPSIALPS